MIARTAVAASSTLSTAKASASTPARGLYVQPVDYRMEGRRELGEAIVACRVGGEVDVVRWNARFTSARAQTASIIASTFASGVWAPFIAVSIRSAVADRTHRMVARTRFSLVLK